jgi:hypothetical protein
MNTARNPNPRQAGRPSAHNPAYLAICTMTTDEDPSIKLHAEFVQAFIDNGKDKPVAEVRKAVDRDFGSGTYDRLAKSLRNEGELHTWRELSDNEVKEAVLLALALGVLKELLLYTDPQNGGAQTERFLSHIRLHASLGGTGTVN